MPFLAALRLNCAAMPFPAALRFLVRQTSLKTSLSALPFRDNALFLRPSSPLRIKIAEKRRQQEEKENRKRAQKWGDNLHTRRKRFSALRAMNPNLANRFRDAHRLMTMRTGKITVRLAVLPAALV